MLTLHCALPSWALEVLLVSYGGWWFVWLCLQSGFLLLTNSAPQYAADSKAKKEKPIFSSDYVLILEIDGL